MKPEKKHRQAKARFWRQVGNNPLVDPALLSKQDLARYSGSQQINDWLADPEFHDWFFNADYNRQQLEAGAEEAIEVLLEEAVNKENKASDRIKAAFGVLELAGYQPPKVHKHQPGDGLDGMTEDQLRAFVLAQARTLGLLPSGDN